MQEVNAHNTNSEHSGIHLSFEETQKTFTESSLYLGSSLLEKVITLSLTGFGFVSILAWEDSFRSMFTAFIYSQTNSVFGKVLYAFLLTCVTMLASFLVSKYLTFRKEKQREQEQKKETKTFLLDKVEKWNPPPAGAGGFLTSSKIRISVALYLLFLGFLRTQV
jgi:ABC-type Fe3+ transport system permease subunit